MIKNSVGIGCSHELKVSKLSTPYMKHCQVEVQKEYFGHHFQTIRKLLSNEFNFHTEVVNSI